MEEKDAFIIGVSGPSGSGKSSLVKKFLHPFLTSNGYDVRVIHGDGCFQGRKCDRDEELGLKNVEVPKAYNFKNMLNRIERYKNEQNEKNNNNEKEEEEVGEIHEVVNSSTKKKMVILIEGFLMFCGPDELLDQMDLKLFLFANKPTLYERRKNRRRRKNLDLFKKYYERYVWPCFVEHHQPVLQEIDLEYRQKEKTLDTHFFFLEKNNMFALETENLTKDDVFIMCFSLLYTIDYFHKNIK